MNSYKQQNNYYTRNIKQADAYRLRHIKSLKIAGMTGFLVRKPTGLVSVQKIVEGDVIETLELLG